jgi:2-iminobutanoate/2-iminopropanoate deaminase
MSKKRIIETSNSSAPIGPYSKAVQAGDFIFLSGVIALTPQGELLNHSIEVETIQVMENIKSILKDANVGFENVVKSSIFLSDMSLFNDVNEVYKKYFTGEYPARETVAVKGLPRNANVEISMIVLKN